MTTDHPRRFPSPTTSFSGQNSAGWHLFVEVGFPLCVGLLVSTSGVLQFSAQLFAHTRQVLTGRRTFSFCFSDGLVGDGTDEAVGLAKLGEIGWTKIEVTSDTKLFEGLPREFYSFSSHYDEVKRVPEGFRSLARSSACGIQAMQLEGKPVFGIQFHPERDAASAERRYEKAKRDKTKPELVLNVGRRKTLFDPKVGERIFGNFLSGNLLS